MQVISLETAILKLSKQIKMLEHYCSLSQKKPRWQGVLFMALRASSVISNRDRHTVLQSFLNANFSRSPRTTNKLNQKYYSTYGRYPIQSHYNVYSLTEVKLVQFYFFKFFFYTCGASFCSVLLLTCK